MNRLDEGQQQYTPAESECRKQFLGKYFETVCDRLLPFLEERSYTKLSSDYKQLEGRVNLNGGRVRLLITLTLPKNRKLKHRNVGVSLSWGKKDRIPTTKISEWTNELPSATTTRIIKHVFTLWSLSVSDYDRV